MSASLEPENLRESKLNLMGVEDHSFRDRFEHLCGPGSEATPALRLYIEGLAENYLKFKAEADKRKQDPTHKRVTQTNWSFRQDPLDAEIDIVTRHKLLRRFGDFSMAFSVAFQPRLSYFGDQDGLIAFRKRWGMKFALADPLTSSDNRVGLMKDFIQEHRHPVFGRPCFCQVSRSTAQTLQKLGYRINEMGFDTTLRLADYTFAGKSKEWLRYAANWMKRRDYVMREQSFAQVTPEQIEAVSEDWRKTRTVKRKEVRFLNRPIQLMDEPDVRKFYCLNAQGEVQAFIFLDPIYRNGEIIGYVTAFKRRRPSSPQYTEQALMKHIIEVLKDEGVSELRLGLSPFDGISDKEFKHNWLTGKIFRSGFHFKWINRYCYNVVGHAEYKRRFRGIQEQTYFASPGRFDPPRLLTLIAMCGIA